MVVSYFSGGPTKRYILDAIRNYPRKTFVRKYGDDGSSWISNKLETKNIRVCGVNTTQCVADTVWGVGHCGFNVSVVKDACADLNENCYDIHGNNNNDVFDQSYWPGVKILYGNRKTNLVT
jgi:hypothetical protein